MPTILVRISESQKRRPLDISCLHTVVFAGEVFHKSDFLRFYNTLPNITLYNWYGPTETNVCTFHKVTPLDIDSNNPIPIGRPCPYSKVKIVRGLDDTVGELLVSGLSLMSGYWVDNDLDNEKFILGLDDEEIYYATGDLVKVEDGNLQYCGRKDSQIKRHGYRIELGEIENCALQIENVSDTASIYLNNEIILYVVLNSLSSSVDDAYLIQKLMASIPPYMKPDKLRIVRALQRNERGKIDKLKLMKEHQNITKA